MKSCIYAEYIPTVPNAHGSHKVVEIWGGQNAYKLWWTNIVTVYSQAFTTAPFPPPLFSEKFFTG